MLRVELHQPAGDVAVTSVPATLDVRDDGGLIGVEILNLAVALGASKADLEMGFQKVTEVTVNYDSAEDALYLRVGVGHSREQPLTTAQVGMDSRGWLTFIEVPWTNAEPPSPDTLV
jgi:hypothetical protein